MAPAPHKDTKRPAPAEPRPSASVLLISPTNQILLLQRVKQSSSFPSAHVFPGGNLSSYHDYIPSTNNPTQPPTDPIPPPTSPSRHTDGPAYRLAAIRETFEESGLLLARNNGFGRLIEVDTETREAGRKEVHGDRVPFPTWLARHGGRADVDGLIPFTRWVTPTNVPRRFTTQMYLYFMPMGREGEEVGGDGGEEVRIPVPTTDGGLEHTTAQFLPASAWCRLAQEGRIILFPPQFYLLHLVAQHLDGLRGPTEYGSVGRDGVGREEMERRRKSLFKFARGGDPLWADACISPTQMAPRGGGKRDDGRQILALHRPGPELEKEGSGRRGPKDDVVLVEFRKEGPRRLAVVSREEALAGGNGGLGKL